MALFFHGASIGPIKKISKKMTVTPVCNGFLPKTH
jgi:hypothetical protein